MSSIKIELTDQEFNIVGSWVEWEMKNENPSAAAYILNRALAAAAYQDSLAQRRAKQDAVRREVRLQEVVYSGFAPMTIRRFIKLWRQGGTSGIIHGAGIPDTKQARHAASMVAVKLRRHGFDVPKMRPGRSGRTD